MSSQRNLWLFGLGGLAIFLAGAYWLVIKCQNISKMRADSHAQGLQSYQKADCQRDITRNFIL